LPSAVEQIVHSVFDNHFGLECPVYNHTSF
jgi:hypothetical protein